MIHAHSMISFKEGGKEMSKRARAIVHEFRKHGKPMTDREIAMALGFSDMNSVRPRITELCSAGILGEVDSVKCPTTGKMVRKCALFS